MGYIDKCLFCGKQVKLSYKGQKAICDSCRSDVQQKANRVLDRFGKVF